LGYYLALHLISYIDVRAEDEKMNEEDVYLAGRNHQPDR
jgi:hypothetical protein